MQRNQAVEALAQQSAGCSRMGRRVPLGLLLNRGRKWRERIINLQCIGEGWLVRGDPVYKSAAKSSVHDFSSISPFH